MKIICSLILSLAFLLASCGGDLFTMVNLLESKSKKVAKKHNLTHEIHMVSSNGRELSSLSIQLAKNKKMDLVEARKLFVSVHQDAYSSLSKEKFVKKYAGEKAILADDLSVAIEFKDSKGYLFHTPYVSGILNDKNKVIYMFIDEKSQSIVRHEETLEEAYESSKI
jgi:hypothetical protein